ncbi:P-loop containing nucleoside triphosphate hydrolase protein [Triangularia setosa]|uniref:P-loop containing nucleoside triphosphate hydrolase protein n=1 Tax=Triangularia setosa TaxID=2587417 RepID=A0AAN6WBA1_9PEZI|nr:P-loop containing nucleoside triphosphate hydrolase protein [Podospora setosa]
MAATQLDLAAVQQLAAEQRALLDTIDELRKLGLGKFVQLPQLIVVGDQSSGKSSVLEAISRVRFPIRDGLCTRFATELVLRQATQIRVNVQIQNDAGDVDDHVFDRTGVSNDELPAIIEEAKEVMGVGVGSNTFSEQVLRVEISGPDVPQLTLVDLPGFYHNETESQEAGGVAVVDRLAERYMRQKNSIILAVVSAQSELAAQKVLNEAKKHDSSRERTLGIITKPDKVDQGSHNEGQYLRLADNKEGSHKLALSWHVLRNRTHMETTSTDAERDETEKSFFRNGVWATIKAQDRGIEALRDKLSQVLLAQIQRKLPELIEDIEQLIKQRQVRLKELGEQRSTPQAMRTYLTKISSRFRELAGEAVRGNYLDDFFGGLYPDPDSSEYTDARIKKLRALVRDLNRTFAHVLLVKGNRRNILWDDDSLDGDSDDGECDDKGAADNDGSEPEIPHHLHPLLEHYPFEDPATVSLAKLKGELEAMASENQGIEFPGLPNNRLTLRLFRDQSQPWEGIAQCHIKLITEISQRFTEKLVDHIVGGDAKTAQALLREYVDPFFQERKTLLDTKLQELLYQYMHGYDPVPLLKNMRSRRGGERRVQQTARQLEEVYPNLDGLTHEHVCRAVLKAASQVTPSSDFGTDKIIESMANYYDRSLDVFIDNVVVLGLENCLLRHLPTILDPDLVPNMTDEDVEKVAAESRPIRQEREELQVQLAKLQSGHAACRAFQPRDLHSFSSSSRNRLTVAGANFVLRRGPSLSPTPIPSIEAETSATPGDRQATVTVGRTPSSPSTQSNTPSVPRPTASPADTPAPAPASTPPSISAAKPLASTTGGLFAAKPPASTTGGLFATNPPASMAPSLFAAQPVPKVPSLFANPFTSNSASLFSTSSSAQVSSSVAKPPAPSLFSNISTSTFPEGGLFSSSVNNKSGATAGSTKPVPESGLFDFGGGKVQGSTSAKTGGATGS